jgi:hypothetical protein
MSEKHPPYETQILLLLVLLGFFLRVWGITFGLPFHYHPDEEQYVPQALGFLSGDLNPHDFVNPSLFKYTLGIFYAACYFIMRATGSISSLAGFLQWINAGPSLAIALARLISAWAGTATCILVYKMGCRAYGRQVGLPAAVLLSGTFLHARDAHYGVNDTMAAFLVAVAVYFCLRILQHGRPRDYLLAGMTTGMSIATKHTSFLLVPFILAAHLLKLWSEPALLASSSGRSRASALQRQFTQRLCTPGNYWRELVTLSLIGSYLAIIVTFALCSPYSLLDWPAWLAAMKQSYQGAAYGYRNLQAEPAGGYLFYINSLIWGAGWPMLVAFLIGMAVALARHKREDLLLVAYPLLLYLYMGRQLMYFARFMIPALPVLAVLGARGVIELTNLLPLTRRWQAMTNVAIALLLLWLPVRRTVWHDYILTRTDTRTLAREWVLANIPADSNIFSERYGPPLPDAWYAPPGTNPVYNITLTNMLGENGESAQHYIAQGIEYFIISSYEYNRVLRDPGLERNRRTLYALLGSKADLLREFSPYSGSYEPPFTLDQVYGPANDVDYCERPGPVIKIYKAPGGQ